MAQKTLEQLGREIAELLLEQSLDVENLNVVDWQLVIVAKEPNEQVFLLGANQKDSGVEGLRALQSVPDFIYANGINSLSRPFMIDMHAKLTSILVRSLNRSTSQALDNPAFAAPMPGAN